MFTAIDTEAFRVSPESFSVNYVCNRETHNAIWYVMIDKQSNIWPIDIAVRLGNSGLKVSKLILGCMSYGMLTCCSNDFPDIEHCLAGSPDWQGWLLEEGEAIKHIKFA
jgi:hypothetical protein